MSGWMISGGKICKEWKIIVRKKIICDRMTNKLLKTKKLDKGYQQKTKTKKNNEEIWKHGKHTSGDEIRRQRYNENRKSKIALKRQNKTKIGTRKIDKGRQKRRNKYKEREKRMRNEADDK